MVLIQGFFTAIVVLILSAVENGLALKCWQCTSQTDATCRDFFNTTRILLNQRQMDYTYSYGNLQPARNDPHLRECEGMHTSTYSEFKNVCIKRVLTVPNAPDEVHRECRMVHKGLKAGTCPDDIVSNRARYLEFCDTCEYDGCNSASTNKLVFVGLAPALLLLLRK